MFCTPSIPGGWTQACADAIAYLQESLPRKHRSQASVAVPSAMATLSDEDCMVRYQQGDTGAFRTLYYRYRDKLHRYTLRLATRSSEAEEVFQEVWVTVIRSNHTYHPDSPFAAWLSSIAHRRAADRWRTLSRHAPDWKDHADADGADSFEQHAPVVHHTPERHVQNDALREALLAAVQALPPPQREAFLLKAEGDLSLEEIASISGVTRETVKSRLRYAQRRLREALESWQ